MQAENDGPGKKRAIRWKVILSSGLCANRENEERSVASKQRASFMSSIPIYYECRLDRKDSYVQVY